MKQTYQDIHTSRMELMMGPSHPATHGTIRMDLALDGETIVEIDIDPGYLHRGFEKECEDHTWNQVIPYTDRLNYVSSIINNVAYVMAVEKLCGIDKAIPPRGLYLRTILSEMSRVADHLTCLAAVTMELGAFTAFLYFIKAREWFYELLESVTGARVTYAWTRVGGVRWDIPNGFHDRSKRAISNTRQVLKEIDWLFTKNRIFMDRNIGIGVISQEDAISYGITGPFLRSTGIYYDVRKAHPYLVYDEMEFEVPLGTNGDNYDRYLVRMKELEQSMRIIEQALAKLPGGPVSIEDPAYTRPEKEKVYTQIEALINHFKLVLEDIKPPPGEAYGYVEGANGELGFYIVSKGESKPYKCRVHPPCFPIMAALGGILPGYMLPDIIPTFGSVNMIGGEMDR